MSGAEAVLYPFSAIVGHDDLRTALLVNAVDPTIGGVLVRGEKGTAKSTAVRSLARLLPEIEVVDGCPYSCDPGAPDARCPAGPHDGAASTARPARLVELPVGASADRVTGSLDLTRALREGERAFEPGLLTEAHRGLLYVDEVNLLADHLVDLLLDAAALGVNYVEREGVSVRHPSRFLLVGTMNPEEGELRPQLLDRFGLSVEVRGSREPAERAEVVRRRLAFDADPAWFAHAYQQTDAELSACIRAAREALARVLLPDRMVALLTQACAKLDVGGLRADIVCAKTARALAALDGAAEVGEHHVRRAALLALAHRCRRGPLEQPGLDPEELQRALAPEPDDDPPEGGPNGGGSGQRLASNPDPASTEGRASEPDRLGARGQTDGDPPDFEQQGLAPERRDDPLPGFSALRIEARGGARRSGGRKAARPAESGRVIGARPHQLGAGIALLPTARAAALRRPAVAPGLSVERSDLRSPLLAGEGGALLVFVVDTSGSMAARRRMAAVKGAVIATLADAYQHRDLVALISARESGAELVLAPTASVETAATRLRQLRAGGKTPLGAGLDRARELIRAQRLRGDDREPIVLLVTDGRANAGSSDPAAAARHAAARLRRTGASLAVVDSEQGPVRLGLAAALAESVGAPVVSLDALAPARATPAWRAA